jgi:3-phenylpropionate/trans-cinnamate dioxygenase ferredoxin reductase component
MKVVIIGASHAGVAAAAGLRAVSQEASVTVIGAEAALPYQRPPLSKGYASGETDLEGLALRPRAWFDSNRIDLRLAMRVTAIDRERRELRLPEGGRLAYDRLILATGASPRRLPDHAGGNLGNVLVMRDLADADALKERIADGRRVVIIGGGYVGLEAAAVCAKAGMHVTVVEAAEHILRRVACAATARFIRAVHEAHGVNVLEGVNVTRIAGIDGVANGVELANGTLLPADLVLVGIGVVPETALAHDAGLRIANGIVVDQHLRTNDAEIYAIGDVASFPRDGHHVRVESVQNANDQAAVAAVNALGADETYNAVPWFWSDQYDMKLQIAGLNSGHDDVVQRVNSETSRSHFYFRGDQFIAVDCFNDGASYMVSRRLMQMGRGLTKAQAADLSLNFKSLLK